MLSSLLVGLPAVSPAALGLRPGGKPDSDLGPPTWSVGYLGSEPAGLFQDFFLNFLLWGESAGCIVYLLVQSLDAAKSWGQGVGLLLRLPRGDRLT